MVPVRVAAQADLRMFLNPELGKQISRADYRYTFYPERPVDQGGTLAMMEHRLSAYVPLAFQNNSRDEFAIAARGIFLRTSTTTHSYPIRESRLRSTCGMSAPRSASVTRSTMAGSPVSA